MTLPTQTRRQTSWMQRLAGSMVSLLVIAGLGIAIGVGISRWSARLHPPLGWDDWFVTHGPTGSVRKELIPDRLGAVRVVGQSRRDLVWDVGLVRRTMTLPPATRHRLTLRMRSTNAINVLLLIKDTGNPSTAPILERCFSTFDDWKDYEFTFVTPPAPTSVNITLFVGSTRTEIDVEHFQLEPLPSSEPPSAPASEKEPLPLTNWTLNPPLPGGRLHYPAGPRSSVDVSIDPVDGRSPLVELVIPPASESNEMELTIRAQASRPITIPIRLESATAPRQLLATLPALTFEPLPENSLPPGPQKLPDGVALMQTKPIDARIKLPSMPTGTSAVLVLNVKEPSQLSIFSVTRSPLGPPIQDGSIDARRLILATSDQAAGRLIPADHHDGPLRMEIDVDSGKKDWVVRAEVIVPCTGPGRYRLDFDARADQPRVIRSTASQGHEPWQLHPETTSFDVGADWTPCSFTFTTRAGDKAVRLGINGASSKIPFEIARLRLTPISD